MSDRADFCGFLFLGRGVTAGTVEAGALSAAAPSSEIPDDPDERSMTSRVIDTAAVAVLFFVSGPSDESPDGAAAGAASEMRRRISSHLFSSTGKSSASNAMST